MFRVTLTPLADRPFTSARDRARSGEKEALDELVRRFYPAVEALVHHRLATDLRQGRPWLHARFSTGDVVQTVFQSVLLDVGAFQGKTEESFVGYLAAVVHNRIIDALRFHEAAQRDGRRGSQMPTGFDSAGTEVDPADSAMSAEGLVRLHTALACFGPREQHLLRARIDGVASFLELAEQLGYGSESAARRAFFDAQARLVVLLKDDP